MLSLRGLGRYFRGLSGASPNGPTPPTEYVLPERAGLIHENPDLYDTGLDSLNRVLLGLAPRASSTRLTMLRRPFDPTHVQTRQYVQTKPRGLWYGCGFGWINYVSLDLREHAGRYLYELDVDASRLLVLDERWESWRAFITEFGVREAAYGQDIHWPRVQQQYDGIQACAGHTLLGNRWDVPSGCLWNLRALRRITCLHD